MSEKELQPDFKELEEDLEKLRHFTDRLGLISGSVSSEDQIVAVLGVKSWCSLYNIEIESYKLAGKESTKVLSALLSRSAGASVEYKIGKEEFLYAVNYTPQDISPKVLITYELLVRELSKLTSVKIEEIALRIAYDFLASRDDLCICIAQLLIINYFKDLD